MTLQPCQQGQVAPAAQEERQLTRWESFQQTVSENSTEIVGGLLTVGLGAVSYFSPAGIFNGLGNLVSSISGLWRKNMPEVAETVGTHYGNVAQHVGDRLCDTADNGIMRLGASADHFTDETNGTLRKIGKRFFKWLKESGHRVLDIGENSADRLVKVVEVAAGAGGTFLAYTLVVNKDSARDDLLYHTAQWTVTAGLVAGVAGCIYVIARKGAHRKEMQLSLVSQSHTSQIARSLAIMPMQLCTLELAPDSTDLMKAAYRGDIRNLLNLQAQGAYLDERDSLGRTAFHYAAGSHNQAACEWLWYFGSNIEALDKSRRSPIHYVKEDSPLHACLLKLHQTKNRFEHKARPMYLFYPPEYLICKGGGPKGIAYVGAHQYLEEQNLLRNLRGVSGTSAGAINATLIALGYNSSEMKEILGRTNLTDFLDHPYRSEQELMAAIGNIVVKGGAATINEIGSTIKQGILWWFSKKQGVPAFETFKQIYGRGGFCKGEKFLHWIEKLIKAKTGKDNCTFKEYRAMMAEKGFKHLYVYATQIKPCDVVCINSEEEKWDNVVIADAIRSSMSIPMVFEPHTLCIKPFAGMRPIPAPQFGEYMDGGLIKNMPVETFDHECYSSVNPRSHAGRMNFQALALNLVDPVSDPIPELADSSRANLKGAMAASVKVFAESEEILLRKNQNHRMRMIDIDNRGMGLITGFFASEKEKKDLMESGYNCCRAFFEEQEKLSFENEEHDPMKLLSIFARPQVRVMPQMPLVQRDGVFVRDYRNLSELQLTAALMEDEKKFGLTDTIQTTFEQVVTTSAAQKMTTAVELVDEDQSASKLVETEDVMQILLLHRKRTAQRKKQIQSIDNLQKQSEFLNKKLTNQ